MLKEIIYNHFEKEWDGKERRHFSPSSAFDCRRKLFYKMTNAPVSDPIDNAGKLKMELGTATHVLIQDILKAHDLVIENEEYKEINYMGIDFHYRPDNIVKIGGKNYLLEIKSTYFSGFNAIEDAPKNEHIAQLGMYMLFEKINNAVLLYIGRDNAFIVEYIFELDGTQLSYIKGGGSEVVIVPEWGEHIDKLMKNLQDLLYKIEAKQLPDRDYTITLKNAGGLLSWEFQKDKEKYKTDWHCSYCSWKGLCWKEVLEEAVHHKFYIKGEFIDTEEKPSSKGLKDHRDI